MDIGANKPSLEEQQETPHHLIDVCEPGESCSSGDFVRMAVPAIEDILRRGKTPIVVGGSTMWTDWLIKGVPDAPKASKDTYDTIQQLLIPYEQSQDWDGAIQLLSKYAVDVDHAEGGVGVGVGAGISRNDWYRLRRALEVFQQTATNNMYKGKYKGGDSDDINATGADTGRVCARKQALPDGIDIRCFFISEERADLYRVIDSRCEEIIRMGLLEEVTSLVETGSLVPDSVASKAIGYRQTLEYFQREVFRVGIASAYEGTEADSRGECGDINESQRSLNSFRLFVKDFATATRNYAQRQMKWFRKDGSFIWIMMQQSLGAPSRALVADEIQYWVSQPRDTFEAMIRSQQSSPNTSLSTSSPSLSTHTAEWPDIRLGSSAKSSIRTYKSTAGTGTGQDVDRLLKRSKMCIDMLGREQKSKEALASLVKPSLW